jgi:hypothetical protein
LEIRLQLDPVHHLTPIGDGEWLMTGSDPQFLVRGPFGRGVWEWQFRAGVRAETRAPAAQIYHAPDGGFSEAASAQFAPLPRDPAVRTLRFWLPYDATVLRFDPADAPGTLVLGEIVARRRGRMGAAAAAFVRQARRHGMRGVAAWIRELAAASRHGGSALRKCMVDLITADDQLRGAEWIAATVAARAPRYHARPEKGLLSLISTVYDTPPAYLRELADSLEAQTWRDYEWVLLDNGSRRSDTRAALAKIARDPRVKLLRAEPNVGILGGMRHVLEQATGRYVLPVDSDDYLFPDALAIMAAALQRNDYPPIAYSDEDKLRDGRHVDPFEKPGWDPVLFRNCCYIAHLCAIRRDDAMRLSVYTDRGAEGCHDWDTFLRFQRAGLPPVHVPELLYSWRMHGGSTAANVDAKDYVINSQRHVLERHLAESGLSDRFTVVRSPLFPSSPDWWIRRARTAPAPVALVLHGGRDVDPAYPVVAVVRAPADEPPLRVWQRAAASAPAIAVIDTRVTPLSDEWLWEMIGLRESFPDAAIVGGRLLDANRMLVDGGRPADDPGYFGTALKQRSTNRVSLRLALLDSDWLRTIDPAPYDALDLDALAAPLAERARASHARVIFSPFIEATV